MSDYKKCGICDQWHRVGQSCKPEYKVFHEDHLGDDFKMMRADSPEDAALVYAQYYNIWSEYQLMNEEIQIEVEVGDERLQFVISAQPDIHYSAKQV